jgi:hypothetical protein
VARLAHGPAADRRGPDARELGNRPFAGDAFDLWFKANTRNLDLARRWLAEPERSTRDEWLALLLIVGILVGMVAFVLWAVAAVISAFLGLF